MRSYVLGHYKSEHSEITGSAKPVPLRQEDCYSSDESAQYGLRLFQQLNLQLLIVTPLQKIHIIEPYVSSVGFVHNEEGKSSKLRNLTIEEYREEKAKLSRGSD